jgi:hypothetical protein
MMHTGKMPTVFLCVTPRFIAHLCEIAFYRIEQYNIK